MAALPPVDSTTPSSPDLGTPTSRRAMLAAAGGAAAAVVAAMARPAPAAAAAGGNLILGANNDSGTSQTILNNAGLGAAFTLKTTNVATGATGIFGYSNSTQVYATKGVYGRADGPNSYGVYGLNMGTAGTGAAIFADGNANPGLIIDVNSNSIPPLKVNSNALVTNLNADQTDGWSLGCPSGTTYSQGLCFEQTNRAAQNVYGAADTCAGLGGLVGQIYRWRLPTIHQLRSARDAYLITLDASGEHTDSLHDFWNGASSQTNSWTAFEGGTLGDVVGGTTRKFRCVTSPYSYNLSFIILSQQNQYPAPQAYRPAGVDAQGLVTE